MPYLVEQDFHLIIQEGNLQQVIRSDNSILLKACATAQEEAISHLVQKYDTSREFTDTTLWSALVSYNAYQRVIDGGTPANFYYAQYPAPVFDSTLVYRIGDKVFWKGSVYTCIQATDTSNIGSIDFYTYANVPPLNIFPDDIYNGAAFWGVGIPYSVPAGTLLTNTIYWTPGDNRSQKMVEVVMDIALYKLHKGITPRNVPEIRAIAYQDAMQWLINAADGKTITAPLPRIQPIQGRRNRYGSNIKNHNSY